MTCVFCQIAASLTPAEIVWRGPDALAFLDHHPLFPGHVLLIPANHFETLADLPPAQLQSFFETAQKLQRAVESAMQAQGTFIAINNRVSQSVPHLHVHIVPRTKGDGLKGFFWPRRKYTDNTHLSETAAIVRAAMALA